MRTGLIVMVSLAASAALLTAGVAAFAIGAPPADAPGQAIDAAPAIVGDWNPATFNADASHQAAVAVEIPSAIAVGDASTEQGVSGSDSSTAAEETPETGPDSATSPSSSPTPTPPSGNGNSGNSGNGNGNSGNGNGNSGNGNGNSGNGNGNSGNGNGNSGNGNGNSGNGNANSDDKKKDKSDD